MNKATLQTSKSERSTQTSPFTSFLSPQTFLTLNCYDNPMANIRRKSQENYKAAHLLVSNNMFASSIHCAYYACFQFSKFVLDACSNLDYYTQEEESKNMQQSSHEYIIRRMNEELSYIDYQAQIDYQSNMNRLKRLRKKADYSNNEITPTDARKALDFAEKTVNVLKHIYDIL